MQMLARILAGSIALLPVLASAERAKPLHFVLIPKVVHPWFDEVNNGAQAAAAALTKVTGAPVVVDYRAPHSADVVEQNDIIERSIATRPDGLIVDLLDAKGNRAVLEEALGEGVPVTIFDSIAPDGMDLTSVGADFCEQAKIAADRLVELIHGKGEVAIMMGVPTAPNHAMRAECHQAVFKQHPEIKVVATGVDNDSIETAQKQAAAIMQAHPNLAGWVACDAAGPVGIGQAIKEAGKAGTIQFVGMDDLPDMLQLVRDGVADSTSATRPGLEGYWSVVAMWQKATGHKTPKYIDTGISMLTKQNLTQ